MVITKSGKYIKSTTINYVGEGYHYALGINYDYTSLGAALSVLEDLTKTSSDLDTTISEFTNTHLEEVFSDCVALIGKPAAAMLITMVAAVVVGTVRVHSSRKVHGKSSFPRQY